MVRSLIDWHSELGVTADLADELHAANLSPGEDAEVLAIISAWGDEEADPTKTQSQARAELAARVRKYLRGEVKPTT